MAVLTYSEDINMTKLHKEIIDASIHPDSVYRDASDDVAIVITDTTKYTLVQQEAIIDQLVLMHDDTATPTPVGFLEQMENFKREIPIPGNILNIMDYGAHSIDEEGYETFNSTTAIESAITALSGERLYIPNGVYNLDNLDAFNVSNITVIGQDVNNTILQKTSGASSDNPIATKSNLSFLQIHFKDYDQFKFEWIDTVYFGYCNFSDFGEYGIMAQWGGSLDVYYCRFVDIGADLTDIHSQGNAIYLSGNTSPCHDITITNCYFEECKGDGAIFIQEDCNGFIIDNNEFKNNMYSAVHGWQMDSTVDTNTISNNLIYGCGLGTPASGDTTWDGENGGVGCSSIYILDGGEHVTANYNRVYESVENGLEGSFKESSYNLIVNTGVWLGTRPTPSIEGMYLNVTPTNVHHNTIIGAMGHGITCFTNQNVTLADITIDNCYIECNLADDNYDSIALYSTYGSAHCCYSNVVLSNNTTNNAFELVGDNCNAGCAVSDITQSNNTIL